MKRTLFLYAVLLAFLSSCTACTERTPADPDDPIEVQPTDKKDALSDAKQDLTRSLRILEAARKFYFDGKTMYRYYNPFTGTRPSEKASVWMYTSSIEAVNAFLAGISELKEAGDASLYDQYYGTWSGVLSELISGLDWYEGTFSLISYTGRADWSVYGVNRGTSPHTAAVDGINNVYDDQEWLVRELLHSYRITGEEKYLVKAEYLASYVIDGWDCTLKSDGTEHGGIVWGPGYFTKHSCSNGPFISPLVRLAEHYKDKDVTAVHHFIGADKKRLVETMDKSEYYLMYARKVYDFQKNNLYNKNKGVYYDMLGAKGDGVNYEEVDGVTYRANNEEQRASGEFYTYNTGTMLSGAADLYRITGEPAYLDDMTYTSSAAFRNFAVKSDGIEGCYEYPVDGFSNWFNSVLLRGWVDVSPYYPNVDLQVMSFQHNLDYAFENNLYKGLLPPNLLCPWNTIQTYCKTEGMFEFAYATEYAVLAHYILNKK